MPEPLLFVSHKHSDGKIAQAIASFIEDKSNSNVTVHLSSNPGFKGPKIGKGINDQLRKALWQTEVLILVYTSADQDWQYCMWECGVATHPNSTDSTVIVFQCGQDVPAPFKDVLRVDARKFDDLKRFTNQFLRDGQFFPSLKGALAPNLKDAQIESAAKDLEKRLEGVLPNNIDTHNDWTPWPSIKVELPRAEVDKIKSAAKNERSAVAQQIVKDSGVVVDSSPRVAQLFGLAVVSEKQKFEMLLKTWKEKNPTLDASWFDSCCEQIMVAATQELPIIRWTPMREVGGDSEHTPVLCKIKSLTFAQTMHFELYFLNLSDPRAIPITSQMLPIGDFFYKSLAEVAPESLKLADLIEELDNRKLNRAPILDKDSHIVYIIHRSIIDKFIVDQVLKAKNANSQDLTLTDLMKDPNVKKTIENTFVVVKRSASLDEAKSAMLAKPGCSDIFVTAGGGTNEPVQGWLTNVDLVKGS